mmetsp:Transcript_81662/g.249445  ORF Transcript_81662/g.249445 Transcript_81662/m.249445 type:complete len:211 (-) Transcript_81662:637-1269(-)
MTFLFKMSLSWRRSMICLLSCSDCVFNSSRSFVRAMTSFFKAFLDSSRRLVSTSPEAFAFLFCSSNLLSRSFPVPNKLISSCRACNCACKSKFSSVNLPFNESPSWYCFLVNCRAFSSLSFSMPKCSISARSSKSCFWTPAIASVLRLTSSRFALISFCRPSMVCRNSFKSLSNFSFCRCCLSASSSKSLSSSRKSASSLPPAALSASSV